MLDSMSLRAVLKEIFGIEDKYLVPISTNWFIPTVDPEDKVNTWIGYRIISKKPYARAYQSGLFMVKPFKVQFRLAFVGPDAEKFSDQVMLWEDRTDVTAAFEKYQAQINYTDRTGFTYPVRNGGFNDALAWLVDLSAQTSYEVDTKQKPWISPRK